MAIMVHVVTLMLPEQKRVFSHVLSKCKQESSLTFSTLQTEADSCANSVDPDEAAHYESSYMDPHYMRSWS